MACTGQSSGVRPAVVVPGRYPLVLAVVEFSKPGDPRVRPHRRVAAARLQFREETATTWGLAGDLGDDSGEDRMSALGDSDFLGYGVDSGTGCFLDAAAAGALYAVTGDDGGPLEEAFDADPSGLLPVRFTDPVSGAGLVAFRSGWGGGCYPTWAGHTAAGHAACLVTEFLVVPQDGRTYDEDEDS